MATSETTIGRVVGGPEDNSGSSAAAPAADLSKNEQAQKKYVTASGKEFGTPEELQAYVSGLEEDLVRKTFQANTQAQPATAPAPKANWEEEVAEEMFTDPVGTMRKIKEKVTDEIKQVEMKKDAARAFWDDFYKKNPDLQNAQRIVNLTSKELSQDPEFGKLPAAQVAQKLADEVRMAIKDISRGQETETVINGKPAPALSGSNPTPKVPSVPAKPKSFIEQVKELRAKRRA